MGTQARSIPTSQWQFKADFTSDKPDINEEDEPPERYGMIKALKNITHHRKVKRHPPLQTQRMKRMIETIQIYMSQDQEGGQSHKRD
jgi:hypothetical protein